MIIEKCLSPPPQLCVRNVCPLGTNIFYTQRGGGTNIFLMMMITGENVSGANILSSEARKPPAGARIPGPVGP